MEALAPRPRHARGLRLPIRQVGVQRGSWAQPRLPLPAVPGGQGLAAPIPPSSVRAPAAPACIPTPGLEGGGVGRPNAAPGKSAVSGEKPSRASKGVAGPAAGEGRQFSTPPAGRAPRAACRAGSPGPCRALGLARPTRIPAGLPATLPASLRLVSFPARVLSRTGRGERPLRVPGPGPGTAVQASVPACLQRPLQGVPKPLPKPRRE